MGWRPGSSSASLSEWAERVKLFRAPRPARPGAARAGLPALRPRHDPGPCRHGRGHRRHDRLELGLEGGGGAGNMRSRDERRAWPATTTRARRVVTGHSGPELRQRAATFTVRKDGGEVFARPDPGKAPLPGAEHADHRGRHPHHRLGRPLRRDRRRRTGQPAAGPCGSTTNPWCPGSGSAA